jgi:flagellar basal body-associated protein FliL
MLNPDKCYTQQKQRLTITVPKSLPDKWLPNFYALLAEQLNLDNEIKQEFFDHQTERWFLLTEQEIFFKELDRHAGEQSTYALKAQLLESLSTLYVLFTHEETTPAQKQMISSRIAEDVSQCSPGFINRVNYDITLFSMPQNIDELIALARFHLVDRMASIIAANNPQGIHVHNRVIEVAKGAGFGVWPINTQDTYPNVGSENLSDQAIIKTLRSGFANYFQFFALLNALREEIEALIALHGYQGKRVLDNGYKEGEYSKWSECINFFIPIEKAESLEVDEVSGKIIDVNWQNVKRALLQKLTNEDYVNLSEEEAALLVDEDSKKLSALIPHGYELVQCLVFFSEWYMEQKVDLAYAYLKSKSINEQKAILTILYNEAPQLTVQFKTEPSFQAIYFAIAVAEKDVSAVRAYVEQGEDINEVLVLLFSQEHKSDTLYWLHEHHHLLQKVTLAGINTIITQGKYVGMTVAEILVRTKKGRQLLSENDSLQTLLYQTTMADILSDSLQQAQTERSNVNSPIGFFKKPNPLVTRLVQYVAYGNLTESEKLLKAHPLLLEVLLTEKVTVNDFSRRKVKQKTAFQAALCAMDDELCSILAQYMTKEDIDSQYQAIFPKGHETCYHDQKSFDFNQIEEAISQSNNADVIKALNLELPNTTVLWRKLEQFRTDFAEQSYQEQVFNPRHLIDAFGVYDSQFVNWSWNQNDLFWRQVIGYVQRFLPANIAMDFAQGLCNRRAELKEKSKRVFQFTYGGGSIFPLDFAALSGLGYEYAAGYGGVMTVSGLDIGGVMLIFSKLMSSKYSSLRTVMRSESSYSHPRWCLIQ